jgi:hypothetical protein
LKDQALAYKIENKTILVFKKKSPENKESTLKTKFPSPKKVEEEAYADLQTIKKSEAEKTDEAKKIENAGTIPYASSSSLKKDSTGTKFSAASEGFGDKKLTAKVLGDSAQQGAIAVSNSTPTSPKTTLKNPFTPIQFKKINYGFKGGINSSRINATELNGSKSGYIGTELYAGFFADTRITKKLNLGTELIFSYTDSYHFIELPLQLKYNISEKWNLMAGPKMEYIPDYEDNFIDFKRVGISGEVGSQFQINPLFFAEARYAYGFTPNINDLGLGFYNGTRNTFRLGLGVNFNRQEETGKVDKDLGPMRLRAGLSTGVALTSGYDLTVGADLRIQKELGNGSIGTFTVGYNHYSLKSGFVETNLAYFPIKGGFKFFRGNGLYFAPEAGIAIGTKSEVSTIPFVFGAGIGKATRNGFDISLRYEKLTGRIVDYLDEIKRPAQLALRVEYGFNLNPDKEGSEPFSATKEPIGTRGKSVFAEFGGNGILNANFDTRFKQNRNDGLGFRAGAGTAGTFITLPLALNYIIGKRRHGFEAGVGITPIYDTTDNGVNIIGYGRRDESPKLYAMSLLTAGYRLQSYNGFMLRANTSIDTSPLYGRDYQLDTHLNNSKKYTDNYAYEANLPTSVLCLFKHLYDVVRPANHLFR